MDFKTEQVRRTREKIASVRARLAALVKRFSIRINKASPRQLLAAELSGLWVLLEDARPERMKGYGREFSPEDKADWDKMIEGLISDVKEMRRTVLQNDSKI